MKALFLTLLFFVTLHSYAQINPNDPFKKMDEDYQARMDRLNKQYEKRMLQMQKAYEEHLKEMNQAFEKYLKKGFSEIEQKAAEEKVAEVPKPVTQPDFNTEVAIPAGHRSPVTIPAPLKPEINLDQAAAFSISTVPALPDDADSYRESLTVDFFGSKAQLQIDRRTRQLALKNVNPQSFAIYWNDFTRSYYPIYIASLLEYARAKNLNDWGVYILIKNTADQLFPVSNNREIWCWAMLNQCGYQAKIGYNSQNLGLLLPFMQEVYEKPYYKIEGSNYYLFSGKITAKSIYTYTDSFGGATKKIDLHLPFSLNYHESSNTVSRSTTLPGEGEGLNLNMDKTIMAFLASYPQTENGVYLNAAMSKQVKEDLYAYIKPHLEGKTQTEAVSYLMRYLHHSFAYKTDREQFNKEKMFFPDEIFYYPYSDCEDRTVLFTRLVNELVGLDVVALTYFSHMAAATRFTTPVEGYTVKVDGVPYTITDPTYIDAPIGAVMPEYEKYKPLAIKINNNSSANNIWQMIARTLEQGNEGKLFIADRKMAENGKYILSGWYNDAITIGQKRYQAAGGSRDLWFATFGQDGRLEWFLPLSSSGKAFTTAFNVGKKGNIYALINYTGRLSTAQNNLSGSDHQAYLILGITSEARPFLAENLDFEVPEGRKLAFYGKYRSDGSRVDLLSFPTEKVSFDAQITVDSNNEIVVRGITGEVEGFTKEVPILLATSAFSAEKTMQGYMNDYKNQNYNKHMIALFSAFKLLSLNGGRMSGITVRNLLNEHNPDFYKRNPKLYEGLLRMQFVSNDAGIVNIETYKGENISLYSMKIKNNSSLQITQRDENSYEIRFLNGVQVGKAIVWYDLNSIALNGNTGEMRFDYANDHTKTDVNINEIVD